MLLEAAGWHVCDASAANIHAARGVAIREFPLPGYGFADYLLYVDGKAAGVIEAKKEGVTLTGVETQSDKYTKGLPAGLPRWSNPLPFAYQATGVETRFTNGLDPTPRSRPVFAFHQPKLLAEWLNYAPAAESGEGAVAETAATFLAKLQSMPPLKEEGLWPAQITAINNLEKSLAENRPRALIQMATGSGKTFTSISFIYRLIKFAGARRILFLVDRGNLADQTLKEFQQFVSPYNNYKFTEEYIVQHLQRQPARHLRPRLHRHDPAHLFHAQGRASCRADLDEESMRHACGNALQGTRAHRIQPRIPIETFDFIVTDECHRSIYNLWRQVLEYFDASLIGLTATPAKQTFGFFHQNLVMEYNHEKAVADGVNVGYDIYRIKTADHRRAAPRSKPASTWTSATADTRKIRWEAARRRPRLRPPTRLDRDVVAPDQIRTVLQHLPRQAVHRDLPRPHRRAQDAHLRQGRQPRRRHRRHPARGIRQGQRLLPEDHLPNDRRHAQANSSPAFRNSYHPRIAVTVDMIATGTDIKPLEIVFFMRAVASRNFFEQMKGRGVRIINPDDLKAVTPDATAKDHFVIIDAVGVCEQDKTDARPMEKKPSVSFERLLQAVAFGNTEDDVITSIAGRLARMEHRISAEDDAKIRVASGGLGLKDLAHQLVESLSPDLNIPPFEKGGQGGFAPDQQARITAAKPLCDPALRQLILDIKAKNELTIDHVSQDQVIEAGFSQAALDRARGLVQSFEQFIADHKDEITALQILYAKPYKQRLTFEAVKELADAIEKPPYLWNESQLWQAYAALEASKVKGASGRRILTDLVSLVRFAIHQDNELVPFPERVNANFKPAISSKPSSSPERGRGSSTLGESRAPGSPPNN